MPHTGTYSHPYRKAVRNTVENTDTSLEFLSNSAYTVLCGKTGRVLLETDSLEDARAVNEQDYSSVIIYGPATLAVENKARWLLKSVTGHRNIPAYYNCSIPILVSSEDGQLISYSDSSSGKQKHCVVFRGTSSSKYGG